jgi:TRAP-type C4-dicarboxylate transport system permease small subunit
MTDMPVGIEAGITEIGHHEPVSEGPVEKACRFLSEAALAIMLIVIGVDIISRSGFNYSLEVADEVGGYMLVALAFFSLAVTQVNDGFHRVEFLQDLLSERNRVLSRIVFDVVTLVFVAILFWIFTRFEIAAWYSGNRAPTYLMTPLWLPQLPMVLGMFAFGLAIIRTILANVRRLRAIGKRDQGVAQ